MSSIWVGDLIVAWTALGRRPEHLDRLVDLLGLTVGEVVEEWSADERAGETPRLAPVTPPVTPSVEKLVTPPPPAPSGKDRGVATAAPATRVRALVIEPLEREISPTPVWSGVTMDDAVPARTLLRLQPLFPHATARALVGAAAHSVRQVGHVDLDEAVSALAERRPMRELPRDTARTLRAGIQLVIDRTWAMKPFADDIAILRKQFFAVVGRDRIDELWFSGWLSTCRRPTRVGMRTPPRSDLGSKPDHQAWRPPERGVPVIVVTDLGRADRDRGDDQVAEQWDELFERASAAGCDIVTIVPRRLGKDELDGRTTPVAWDTRTTAGRVLVARARVRG